MYFTNNNRFGIQSGGTSTTPSSDIKHFIKGILVSDWVLSGDTYVTQITHNLDTDNLFVSIYKENTELSMNNVQIVNKNEIKIFNDTAINCKVILMANGINYLSTLDGDNVVTKDGNKITFE